MPSPSGPSPKVSIVCAWYNRAEYLRDTVDSLLGQTYDDYDIVLVNDGSPDPRVRAILEGYSDPRLRVIHQENTGFVGAIRRAIEASSGEYIAVMGAGDVSYPDRLRVQAALLDAHPEYIGVGSSYVNVTIDREGHAIAREERIRAPLDIDHAYITRRRGAPFTHGEVMYRRAIYERVGGYRPFYKFAQDLDLWLRMSRLGMFNLCPEVLYERRSFLNDGISADLRKYVVQIGLANAAQICSRQRSALGYDAVDVFGRDAAILIAPDRFMAGLLARTAIKYLRGDMHAEARLFSVLSRGGQFHPLVPVTAALVSLFGNERLRPLVRRLVARIPVSENRQLVPIKVAGRIEG